MQDGSSLEVEIVEKIRKLSGTLISCTYPKMIQAHLKTTIEMQVHQRYTKKAHAWQSNKNNHQNSKQNRKDTPDTIQIGIENHE